MRLKVRLLASLVFVVVIFDVVNSLEIPLDSNVGTGRSTLFDNGVTRALKYIYTQCSENDDVFWCFKVQSAKLLGRALKVPHINVVDGFSIVRKVENETRTGRASFAELNLNNKDLENLSMKSLDALLVERFDNFVRSRQLQVNLPRLLSFGQRTSQDFLQTIFSFFNALISGLTSKTGADDIGVEGRKKKDDKKYLGPFITAVLLKTAILKMAYHSIAIVAGKALIVGKIALIISAIIGLKKLVSSEGEKTTYEIVKHPQVQQSHTYSSSHAGEYEAGHEGGSYHRSIDDEMMMQDKAYQAWVPTKAS